MCIRDSLHVIDSEERLIYPFKAIFSDRISYNLIDSSATLTYDFPTDYNFPVQEASYQNNSCSGNLKYFTIDFIGYKNFLL